MATDDISKVYVFRVDELSAETLEKLRSYFQINDSAYSMYVIARESKPKLHYHVYAEYTEDVKKKTVQKAFQRVFKGDINGVGTKYYSDIARKPEEALMYTCKQGDIIVHKSSYTDEQLVELGSKWLSKNDYTKAKGHPIDVVMSMLKADHITDSMITRAVFDYYKSRKMGMNRQAMKSIYFAVRARLCETDAYAEFHDFCVK